jgi:hypothetical protein
MRNRVQARLTTPDLPPAPGSSSLSILADLHSALFANVEDRHRSIEFITLLIKTRAG